jgi:hypothetical protein
MKAYNLTAELKTIAGNQQSVLTLGEDGRGRKLTYVKCYLITPDGSRVSCATPAPGKPGTANITGEDDGDDGHWLARISTNGRYVRRARGNVKILSPHKAVVLASGLGAYGATGNTGSWIDILVRVPDGAILRVKPSRFDPYYLRFDPDRVVRIAHAEISLEGIDGSLENYTELPSC